MGERLLELRSAEIRRLAFDEILGRARQQTAPSGLSETSMRVLRSERLNTMEDRMLRRFCIRVYLDLDVFNFSSEKIEHQWWEEAMLNYFVMNQASLSMLQAMFPGTSRTEIAKIRAQLKAPPPGKPAVLTDAEIQAIYNAWRELTETTPDLRERYLQVHDRFPKHSLTTLFAAINVE